MKFSIIQNIFGVEAELLKATDLIEYFKGEREESLVIEYKSFRERSDFKTAILKTVSAFLNSEGGLLILGSPESFRQKDKNQIVQGDLTPLPLSVINKDGIVNSISDAIHPMPVNYRVFPVEFSDGYVYLIEVLASNSKPHQYDNRYFIRLDGQSRPAPHYIVESLFKQIKVPELTGSLKFGSSYRVYHPAFERLNEKTLIITLEIEIRNLSKYINEYDLYYVINASSGKFKDKSTSFFNLQRAYNDKAVKILANGLTYNFTELLQINMSGNFSQIPILAINLIFGGRLSPAIRIDYELLFKIMRDKNGSILDVPMISAMIE